jgi:uncharacterized membrane protein YkvA (DUF1232 family)
MSGWIDALIVLVALYVAGVLALVVAGRRGDAAALARSVPDCAVLVRRLIGDARVPGRVKLLLVLLLAYLASPIDLVPDFVPIAGQVDDAIVLVLVLRQVIRAAGPGVVREHWPGPERSLAVVLRLAYSPAGWRAT